MPDQAAIYVSKLFEKDVMKYGITKEQFKEYESGAIEFYHQLKQKEGDDIETRT